MVYAQLLLADKLGYPLWIPHPDEGRRGGVTLGQFVFDFNVYDDDSGLPPGFQSWKPQDISFISNIRHPGSVISRSLVTDISRTNDRSDFGVSHPISQKTNADRILTRTLTGSATETQITCSTHERGSLDPPEGASCTDLKEPKFFNFLTAEIALQWLDFVGLASLILVSGCIKTRSWSIAAISNISIKGSGSLNFDSAEGGGQSMCSYLWESISGGLRRIGPTCPVEVENQCVFVRGYMLSSR
jgi:hypothetical protein